MNGNILNQWNKCEEMIEIWNKVEQRGSGYSLFYSVGIEKK